MKSNKFLTTTTNYSIMWPESWNDPEAGSRDCRSELEFWDRTGDSSDSKLFWSGIIGDFGLREFRLILTFDWRNLSSSGSRTMSSSVRGIDNNGTFCFRLQFFWPVLSFCRSLRAFIGERFEKVFRGLFELKNDSKRKRYTYSTDLPSLSLV